MIAPRFRRLETWLAAGAVGVAAFLGTPYAQSVPPWVFSVSVAALAVLQLLSSEGTASKALAAPPPKE